MLFAGYCSLVTFREVFFVNKVHRKPESCGAKMQSMCPDVTEERQLNLQNILQSSGWQIAKRNDFHIR